MDVFHGHEIEMGRALLSALQSVPGFTIFGLTDSNRFDERVATYSLRLKNLPPRKVAEKLAGQNTYIWDGNYYTIIVTERLGLEDSGGMVRVGVVHYNTVE